MVYQGRITLEFETKSEDQMQLIFKFLDDAQSLMTCESSRLVEQSYSETGQEVRWEEQLEFGSWCDLREVELAIREIIRQHGLISRADVYELCGYSTNFMDSKRGWTSTAVFLRNIWKVTGS